jgi:hypothetical protein
LNLRRFFALCLLASCLIMSGRPVPAQRSRKLAAHHPPPPHRASSAIDPELRAAIKKAPTAAQYPDQDYACLLAATTLTVRPDGTTILTYREVYKLFNERARDMADVDLDYDSSCESIQVLQARTIKQNGVVLDVAPGDIHTSARFEDYALYDDSRSVSFSLPGIEDNCIIDYTYRQVTRPVWMPGRFWAAYTFTGGVVLTSRYVLKVPANMPFRYRTYNDSSLKPRITTADGGRIRTYTWELRDCKPVEEEPDMPPNDELDAWVQISSLDSWQDYAGWYWRLLKGQAVPNAAIRATVSRLIADRQTDDDKARAIYNWVANRVRYVGVELGESSYRPHPAATTFHNLYGDCKDKATLLITMLGLAGIKAYPALLSADDQRLYREELPALDAFDHCIAVADIGGKTVWLDATAEDCAYGDIPSSDRGSDALVIRDGKGRFAVIPPYQATENGGDASYKVRLNEDGGVETQMELVMRGERAQDLRAQIRKVPPAKYAEVAEGILKTLFPTAVLKEYEIPQPADKTDPYVIKLTFTAAQCAKKVGNLMLLPMSAVTGNSRISSPYSKDTRQRPIVYNEAEQNRLEAVITLPDGYSIEAVPDDLDIRSPLKEYRQACVQSADGKTLTFIRLITTRTGRIPPGEYPGVRAYYEQTLKTKDDHIVLRTGNDHG